MREHLVARLFISAAKPLDEVRADLADMVGAEGSRHRNLFRLAECIELHRSDKIHGHLADLRRRIVRDEAERKYPRHFKRHERRVPANYLTAVYMLGQKFRNDRAEQIRRSGQKIIQRLAPVPAPELNRHEHEVRRLRVAEDASLLNISICAEKSADGYHDGKYPELFAFEKLFLFFESLFFHRSPHRFFSTTHKFITAPRLCQGTGNSRSILKKSRFHGTI